MTEQISPIPARVKNVAIGGHVAGADDIYDEILMENQEVINSRITQGIADINNSKGVAGGLATLGNDGKVPSSQLPSYVETIASSTANRPIDMATGTSIYDTTLGKPIWWNGTAWVDATGATV